MDNPIADYYTNIDWDILDKWKVVRFQTPTDGSCLFHAICNSFFIPYHDKDKNKRKKIVVKFREELANKLSAKSDKDIIYYDILNGGNTKEFSKSVPEYTLDNMKKELKSDKPIGFGYMELIGILLDKDIYILENKRQDIYYSHELPYTIKGNRNSIILYYTEGHYELIGIKDDKGTFITHFDPNHSLIRMLYKRVREIIEKNGY